MNQLSQDITMYWIGWSIALVLLHQNAYKTSRQEVPSGFARAKYLNENILPADQLKRTRTAGEFITKVFSNEFLHVFIAAVLTFWASQAGKIL